MNRGWTPTQETTVTIDVCIIYPEGATHRRAELTTPQQTQSEKKRDLKPAKSDKDQNPNDAAAMGGNRELDVR